MQNKKIALSGIQPTGIFTLGNYVGAVKNWNKLQEEYDCLFFIANLHSLTTNKNPEKLKNLTFKVAALLIACKIDPLNSTLFVQSSVCEHAELCWILQCLTQFGDLKRMTQFKEKSLKNSNDINTGLFCYPVLMAADILLYNPDIIPVGKDQEQHLELTRKIATKFNKTYGQTFKIPKAYITDVGANIMSLTNPLKKMSKSDENENSFISILDPPEKIMEKFKKAVTDNDTKICCSETKPGISNLINIYSCFSNLSLKEVEEKFKNKSYKDFKLEVGEIVAKSLEPIQKEYNALLKDKEYIKNILKQGFKKASIIAKENLNLIYKKIGLK